MNRKKFAQILKQDATIRAIFIGVIFSGLIVVWLIFDMALSNVI